MWNFVIVWREIQIDFFSKETFLMKDFCFRVWSFDHEDFINENFLVWTWIFYYGKILEGKKPNQVGTYKQNFSWHACGILFILFLKDECWMLSTCRTIFLFSCEILYMIESCVSWKIQPMNMQEFSWTDVGLFFWKDICHTHEKFEYNDHNIHDTTKAEELLGHLCVLLGLAIFFLIFRPK